MTPRPDWRTGCAVGPVFELGEWSVQQCPSCLPDEMFSVWQGDMRVVHRLHRYDAETLVRVVVGAIADARRQAVEEMSAQ